MSLRHAVFLGALLTIVAFAPSARAHGARCARIVDGTITTASGETISLGFDEYGYNYQARYFQGSYCDASRGGECDPAYADVRLTMKWNDAWLSNQDCDGDDLLDRHPGFTSYRGSHAWLTNDMRGSYELDGARCYYHQRTIFVAAPLDAELVDDVWYDADGEELGPMIWNDFIVVERRLRDSCGGADDPTL